MKCPNCNSENFGEVFNPDNGYMMYYCKVCGDVWKGKNILLPMKRRKKKNE